MSAPENRCVVDAYIRGYREALASGAEWILEIDGGFSHDPGNIPQFFPYMAQNYDCVFGSRFTNGGSITSRSLGRRVVSWGGTLLTNALIGTKLTDMTSGFEMFRRDVLQNVLDRGIHSQAHFFQTEIKVHCRNLKIAEVPIHVVPWRVRGCPAVLSEKRSPSCGGCLSSGWLGGCKNGRANGTEHQSRHHVDRRAEPHFARHRTPVLDAIAELLCHGRCEQPA